MEDLTSKKFGRLLVIRFHGYKKGYGPLWECICDCGQRTIVSAGHLRSGHTSSCGCLAKEVRTKHSRSRTKLYRVWQGIKQRCLNPNASRYERYGGRGIKICKEWENDFSCFYKDMSPDYREGLQIDRIDNKGDYCKANCRWVKPSENVKHRECSIIYDGINLKDYCKKEGLNYNTVFSRYHYYGWTLDEAVQKGNFKGQRRFNHGKNCKR